MRSTRWRLDCNSFLPLVMISFFLSFIRGTPPCLFKDRGPFELCLVSFLSQHLSTQFFSVFGGCSETAYWLHTNALYYYLINIIIIIQIEVIFGRVYSTSSEKAHTLA